MSNARWIRKHWYAPEAIPIYVVIGGTVLGAGWYITRLARGHSVVWDRKNNPTPWLDVQPNAQTKMLAINQKHEGQYHRDKL